MGKFKLSLKDGNYFSTYYLQKNSIRMKT